MNGVPERPRVPAVFSRGGPLAGGAFAAYVIFVTYVSLRPSVGVPLNLWDKAGHVFAYCLFAILAYAVVRARPAYYQLCLLIFAYSALMELCQSFLPGRVMSGYDMVANALGLLSGAGLVLLLERAQRRL